MGQGRGGVLAEHASLRGAGFRHLICHPHFAAARRDREQLPSPDRGQRDAVLATVKAPPGNGRACGERVATVGLDGVCARRLGARAGRDGETGFQVEQRN